MAKPCRYRQPGTDAWLSEADFKKTLNDGLLDKHIEDGVISIRGFKPKTETAPVAAQPVVESTKTKKDLDKEFNSLNKEYVSDSKLLDEASKNNEDTTEIENRLDETQAKMGEVSNQLESLSEAESKPTLSKKDQEELDFISREAEATESAIIDLQEQIEIEKSNFKEEKERITQEKAKVRSSKMPKDEKSERLEELDAELSDIKDDHDDLVQQYKDDIASEKSDLKRYKNRQSKIQAKANTKQDTTQETKAEPVKTEKAPKAEAKESYKAKAIDKRGGDKAYTVTVNNNTADVVGEERPSPMDPTKMTPGASYKGLPITTNINGQRVVETPTGDTIYLDKPIAEKTEEVKEVKERVSEGKGANITVDVPGRSVSSPVVKMVKNRRTNQWQALKSDGTTYETSDTLKEKAEAIYQQTRTDAKVVSLPALEANTRNRQMVFSNTTNKWMEVNGEGILINVTESSAKAAEKAYESKKEKVKRAIDKGIDKLKFDSDGLIMSSLIPPKLWNEILDNLKESLISGVEVTFTINDIARKIFDKAVKANEITEAEAEKFMNDINSSITNEDGVLSSIKKDLTSETARKIASIGIENASMKEIIESAEEGIESGEIDYRLLINQLINDPRPTTALETAVLIYSKTKMLNDLYDLHEKLNSMSATDDKSKINTQIQLIEDDLLKNEIASNVSGSATGFAFSIRRIMMNSEYELFLPRIQKMYKEAGKEVPVELEKAIKDAQKELRRLNKEIEAKKNDVKKAEDEELVGEIKNNPDKKNSGKKTMSKDGISVSIDKIRESIAKGAKTIEDVINYVKPEVLAKHPNATDRQIRDAISNYGREIRKTSDDISKELNRIRVVGRMISNLEDIRKQLATKVGNIKNPNVRTKAIKMLTDQERELSRSIKEEISKIPVTEEELKAFQENRLEAYKKSLIDRSKELERRIKEKDFSTKKRTKIYQLDKEARDLEIERQELVDKFEYEKTKAQLTLEPGLQKFGRHVLDAFNLPKGLIASIDVSAPFRQGIIPLMSQNPVKSAKAIKQMFAFWANPDSYDKWLSALKSSDQYPFIKASKLYIAEQNGKLSAMEEVFSNNLGNKIPIIGQSYKIKGKTVLPGTNLYKRSESAYVGFLNNLRLQIFMEGSDLLKQQGYTMESNPEVFKDWAKYTNSATGRGDLNPRDAMILGPLFFSPSLIKSRLEVLGLSWRYYQKMSPAVRAMALKKTATFMATTSLVIGLAALWLNNDDDDDTSVDIDPRSSDFGKLKLGNTRVDITGGTAVYYRTLAQIASGEKKKMTTGQIEQLNETFGGQTVFGVGEQFFANKLAPVPSKIYQSASLSKSEKERRSTEEANRDNVFNDIGIPLFVQDITIPLWMRDVQPIMKEQGYGVGSALIALSLLGEGVQYYEPKYKSTSENVSLDDLDDFNDFEDVEESEDFDSFDEFEKMK